MVITEPEARQLKKLYNKAVKENRPQFEFKGQILVTGYAKYLLEYLNDFFKRGKQ